MPSFLGNSANQGHDTHKGFRQALRDTNNNGDKGRWSAHFYLLEYMLSVHFPESVVVDDRKTTLRRPHVYMQQQSVYHT